MIRTAAAVLLCLAASAGVCADKDTIKKYKFEVNPVPFRTGADINPFRSQVPLKVVEGGSIKEGQWKVRISTLKLTSVMVGRRKVAIFKEAHGPGYAYILVDGVLRGPDHNAIPGIEGKIEPIGDRGEFHVTLKQGIETIEFDHVIERLREEEAARASRQAADLNQETDSKNKEGGY